MFLKLYFPLSSEMILAIFFVLFSAKIMFAPIIFSLFLEVISPEISPLHAFKGTCAGVCAHIRTREKTEIIKKKNIKNEKRIYFYLITTKYLQQVPTTMLQI